MKVFVGTSGWSYSWNPDGFDWYAENSNLNAVELNSSFYRFPFHSWVSYWAKMSKNIAWAVKATRWITHRKKFNECGDLWNRFHSLFKPLEESIEFYLFQLPPSTTPKTVEKIQSFYEKTRIGNRFALEPRNEEWFEKEWIEWAKSLGITWVSIDAPILSRNVFKTTDSIYVRMHGRTEWYSHNYSEKELIQVAKRIKKAKPGKAFVFFNNNHAMLENARLMKKILTKSRV